ncbi:MAG TPA: DUF749 domain-containing protein [Methanothermococcus okinawensis]|uniref:DUF749 domain-containing protein n=1 Tax=Methanothermococcus okinawensis TaxID=155863 RepID=A0A832ZBW1_9EURY|nr:DUF749 domain-containing protein [Methanococcaceae archaeon]HIP84581.1 DUF749 domain-containing protein [Methanothermococcus okinawensis]HIP91316.1 DUF749 domain-containing protein [Methanothermococcus okinawensis]
MNNCPHIARLITVLSVEEGLKSELADSIRVRASIENRPLKKEDTVAILHILGTTSYQAFFLDDKNSLETIKSELKKMGASLNYDSERILERYLERKKVQG